MSNNTITLSDAEYDFLINEAREAGRREGLEQSLRLFLANSNAGSVHCDFYRAVVDILDSPKAEGEEPSDDCVAWLQFRQRSYRVCDSDAGGAFRVYRHPKEAEGKETK